MRSVHALLFLLIGQLGHAPTSVRYHSVSVRFWNVPLPLAAAVLHPRVVVISLLVPLVTEHVAKCMSYGFLFTFAL